MRLFRILAITFILGAVGFSLYQSAHPPIVSLAGSSALPDHRLTPGVTNPDVTQSNIQETICRSGWTATIRPQAAYTTALKAKQLTALGIAHPDLSKFEEDHLISLELGGSPTDPRNLWPEPYVPVPGAKQKDRVENFLKRQVCSGALSLAKAQQEITKDWLAVYTSMGGTNLGGLSEIPSDTDD